MDCEGIMVQKMSLEYAELLVELPRGEDWDFAILAHVEQLLVARYQVFGLSDNGGSQHGQVIGVFACVWRNLSWNDDVALLSERSDDCRGLCARCGADRNAGDCGCATGWADPRLAVLQTLRRHP